ncbi:hypothetical protein ACFLYK_01535 [Candidatus Cloacimonadota bacterium]
MRKRIHSRYIFLLAIVLVFTGCSFIPHYSYKQKEKLLHLNLQKWETFQLEGIIEVNHKVFSFRKNIILKKTWKKIRLDIFDSGVLGLSPTPFLSAYYDSLLILRLPGNNELTEISGEKLEKDFSYLDFFLNIEQLNQHKGDILADNQLELDNFLFKFSEDMKIIGIDQPGKRRAIVLEYDEDLNEIIYLDKEKKIADIIIDKITFSEVSIRSLTNNLQREL